MMGEGQTMGATAPAGGARGGRWRYYIPEMAEREDARPVPGDPPGYWEPSSVARLAWSDYWHNHDGWDYGTDEVVELALIDGKGVESRWSVWSEPDVRHHSKPISTTPEGDQPSLKNEAPNV